MPVTAQPETERHYRVELIVLRHLDGNSDTTPQSELRDLGEVLDLNPPPVAEDPAVQPEAPAVPGPTDPAAADLLADTAEPEKPLAVPVDEMSDTMREAWRRLRGSAGFRPELFRAWEQSGDEPFPDLRIHDDEILYQVEPGDPLAEVLLDEHGAQVFTDQTLPQRRQTLADDAVSDAVQESERPPPQYFFRIDGTANLTRTRFLHLDLDIELREPLFDPLIPATGVDIDTLPAEPDAGAAGQVADTYPQSLPPTNPATRSGPAADATAFRIHRIDQRRQVKTEQLEYFDGPVIGILALVTGFDVIAEESAAGDMLQGLEVDPELAE